jgi:hypothetical protein
MVHGLLQAAIAATVKGRAGHHPAARLMARMRHHLVMQTHAAAALGVACLDLHHHLLQVARVPGERRAVIQGGGAGGGAAMTYKTQHQADLMPFIKRPCPSTI